MRTEVFYRNPDLDGRAKKQLSIIRDAVSPAVKNISIADIYITEGIPQLSPAAAAAVFSDPVAQEAYTGSHAADSSVLAGWQYLIEVTYRPGVTNPVAITAKNALEAEMGKDKTAGDQVIIQTAVQYLIYSPPLSEAELAKLQKIFFNPLIQQAGFIGREEWPEKKLPEIYPYKVAKSLPVIEEIDLRLLSDSELEKLSRERLLALSADEMNSIKKYYSDPSVSGQRKSAGLPEGATDVELEMIAQTWSEHCKHKIFQAEIDYTDLETGENAVIKSLFSSYIKKATEELSASRPFLRSVFHDNSGVIDFDSENLVCFKVETHNSPSALDPYGGSITGIVGVNRDIMGTGKGARPFFNTNVLCFGEPDTPESDIPEGLLHPKTVMRGVHHGIVDGGNQSGIPTVAGAFLFDESFTGKPLVFCGTGGILPAVINGEGGWIKHISPGDLAVMLGGRIGKDGIHGATFSSQQLDEESPSSAVQIGDPITQKKMTDFMLEARDKNLYEGLTDNGAGGLSSSLGEMAEYSGGIIIDLDKCPLKYEGLAPWEILVSESQERMSLAVKPEKLQSILKLARTRDVEATVVGEFTDSGFIDIRAGNRKAGMLSMDFLHRGLPPMKLKAVWKKPGSGPAAAAAAAASVSASAAASVSSAASTAATAPTASAQAANSATAAKNVLENLDCTEMLKSLLKEPNIASKEPFVRQYDHEVGGVSIVKPFTGEESDAPSDGAVLRPLFTSQRGVTVTHGICPRYGDKDTYNMAMCAVDEAYRAHIASGGNPRHAAALDNFCWPDPVKSAATPDGEYKLAQLVRACRGLYKACIDYSLPLISGKDSMKNDAFLGGKKVSVRPTLLVSLIGIIDDTRKAVTTDFKTPGSAVYILGETRYELGGTYIEKILKTDLGGAPEVHTRSALKLYESLHFAISSGLVRACHDISDGGLAVALAESCLGGRMGAEIRLDKIPLSENISDRGAKGGNKEGEEYSKTLFSESPSRFIAEVEGKDIEKFEKIFSGQPFSRIGGLTEKPLLIISTRNSSKPVLEITVEEISAAWKREDFK